MPWHTHGREPGRGRRGGSTGWAAGPRLGLCPYSNTGAWAHMFGMATICPDSPRGEGLAGAGGDQADPGICPTH